jgi:hypothetical protein
MMATILEALLIEVGIYGAIAAAMLALWGAAMGVIMVIAAVFRDHGGAVDAIARAR